MCHADQQWKEALLLVLLGIRTFFKADLQVSVAELVYGEPLRIPGELLTPTADPLTQLRRHMARLRPVPAAHHASSATSVHKDLHNCTNFFLRQDATRRALEPLTAVPTRSSRGERKQCSSLCAASPSPCLPTGSSQPTC
jgi:hypothetical protein